MPPTQTPRRPIARDLGLAIVPALLGAGLLGLCIPAFLVGRLLPSRDPSNAIFVLAGAVIGLLFFGISCWVSLRRAERMISAYYLATVLALATGNLGALLIAACTKSVIGGS